MEKLKFEIPSIDRKEDAIEYINEFYEYNSKVNGSGGLDRYLDNYEDWLIKLEECASRIPNEQKVPARTYFLVRESDNKIVGMINIRLTLNENLKKFCDDEILKYSPGKNSESFKWNKNAYALAKKYKII